MKQANLLSYSRINSALARSVTFRRIGPLHTVMGRPCDDFGDVIVLPDQKRIILACADGLGSAPQSRIGAQLAVSFALNHASGALQGVTLENSAAVLRSLAIKTRDYVREIAMAVRLTDAEKEVSELNSALRSQRYSSYSRRWLTSNDEDRIFQFFDRWNDYYLKFSTTFFLAVIEGAFCRVLYIGDGCVGVIPKEGEATTWLHDKDLPKLKSKHGASFTPTLWDTARVSPVMECASLTLVTDGFSRFFDVSEETATSTSLPGAKTGGDDEIDVSDFVCDDDGSPRSPTIWYPGRMGVGQEEWGTGSRRSLAKKPVEHDPILGGVKGAQSGGWLRSFLDGFSPESSPAETGSVEESVVHEADKGSAIQARSQVDADKVREQRNETAGAPSGKDTLATEPGNSEIQPEITPVVSSSGDSKADPVGGASAVVATGAVETIAPEVPAKRDVPPKVEAAPPVDIEPFRSLVDGTAILSKPGDLDQLITVPTRKGGDDETCVSGIVLPGMPASSDISGYGIEETSNLRVLYGFNSAGASSEFVKAVTIQPDALADQLVASILVSLRNASYEKAQKVGSLALQLLCDAIVRSKGKGYETALLEVFRQLVTTKNDDGTLASIALIVHDSEVANYWCTGRFVVFTDNFVEIEPGKNITFGKFAGPFVIMPNRLNQMTPSAIIGVYKDMTRGLATDAEVSSELISMVAQRSTEYSFLVSPKVPDKEKRMAKERMKTALSQVPEVRPLRPVGNMGNRKPDFIRSSDITGNPMTGSSKPDDLVGPKVGSATKDGIGSKSLAHPSTNPEMPDETVRKFDPPVGSKVPDEVIEWEDVLDNRRKSASKSPHVGTAQLPNSVSTEAESVGDEKNEEESETKGNPVSRLLKRLFGGRGS